MAQQSPDLARWLAETRPLIAILRGLTPAAAPACGAELVAAGFAIVEVPLNSPSPFDSVRALADALGDQILVGAGTVTAPDDIDALAEAGGRLAVSPHFDPALVARALALGVAPLPGVFTASELFAAFRAGARAVKLFPGEVAGPAGIKALATIKPPELAILPVGGITPATMADYLDAGARGFGLGGALYQPGMRADELGARARDFVAAFDRWRGTTG